MTTPTEPPGEVTTIWRDGEVLRTDTWQRVRSLPSIAPLPDVDAMADAMGDSLEK